MPRVTYTKHEFTPTRPVYVAAPAGGVQPGPICIWLCGGGLVRTNPVLLWLVMPRLARQGHVVVGPRCTPLPSPDAFAPAIADGSVRLAADGTSKPPLLYATRALLIAGVLWLLLRGVVPDLLVDVRGTLLLFAAVGLLSLLSHACSPSVCHPGHLRDAARAVRWALDHASELGADASQGFVLTGHSAGGQLACLLALYPEYLEDEGIPLRSMRGLVLASPVLDWTWLRTTPTPLLVRRLMHEVFLRAQYGPEPSGEQLAAVSPLALLSRGERSHPDVPVLLLRPEREFFWPVEPFARRVLDVEAYAAALREAGLRYVALERVERGSHVTSQLFLAPWWDRTHAFWQAVRKAER